MALPRLFFRHCEERTDEAIQTFAAETVWIASLRSQSRGIFPRVTLARFVELAQHPVNITSCASPLLSMRQSGFR
jgi:hypothetical protein